MNERQSGSGRWLSMLALGLSVLVATALPLPASAAKVSAEMADALVSKSGLADQLPSIAPSVATGLTTHPGFASNLGEQELQIVLKAFSRAFAPTRLAAEISADLQGRLKPEVAKAALQWLESDVGRKITALEDTAARQAADSTAMERAQELYQRLSPRRAERYERLAKASEVAESSAQLLVNTSVATAYGVASTTGSKTPPDLDLIRREYARNREDLVDTLRGQFNVLFASAYETLPEGELDAYLAFVESPQGRSYHQAMSAAIEQAMVKATRDAGQQIGDAIRAAKGQTGA